MTEKSNIQAVEKLEQAFDCKLWLYYTAVSSYSRESTDDECDGVGSDMSMKGEALEADPFALCLQMRKRTGWTD